MFKKYLSTTFGLVLFFTSFHASAQFGDFLKKAVKEVENTVEGVAKEV